MDESEKLRTAVQDERARRLWAEKELANEADRVQTWRQRAEDRTARIHLLEARLADAANQSTPGLLRSFAGAARKLLRNRTAAPTSRENVHSDDAPPVDPPPAAIISEVQPPVPRGYPSIRVAVLATQRLPFLGEFDTVDLVADSDVLYQADFVFATGSALGGCAPSVVAAIAEWLDAPGRQPFVVWSDAPVPAAMTSIVKRADLQLADSGEASVGEATAFFPGIDLVDPPIQLGEGSDAGPRSLALRRLAYRAGAPRVRARALLELLGIDAADPVPEVGALLISNKPEFVVAAVESILAQENVRVIVVVGLHGDREMFAGVRDRLDGLLHDRLSRVLEFDAAMTLGECLNEAASACASSLLAKFDDDDWYGPHYLEDAVAALDYSQADLVGKGCYFVEIEETGDVYLVRGPEEDYTSHVIGSSMVFRRRLWEDVPFPHRPSRVDSIFLRGVRAADRRIYSTTRYEHGVRRRPDGHTWIVDPAHFTARGSRVGGSFEEVGIDVDDRLASGDA